MTFGGTLEFSLLRTYCVLGLVLGDKLDSSGPLEPGGGSEDR